MLVKICTNSKWHENNSCFAVYGFENAVYDVNEDDRLDTMFQFPAKGEESDVIPGLVISGIITAEATGTSGEQYLPVLMSSTKTKIFACRKHRL